MVTDRVERKAAKKAVKRWNLFYWYYVFGLVNGIVLQLHGIELSGISRYEVVEG
ncbi:hypothetical protein BO78DRAFT_217018 [Aspergillus sclerotiicarbonarius CBS 121057]|uniref:Uncharacterized protein n=1 Tax=Aspergillus sclerotiicarbonarius (strain CBS 121057 / IBT 28362) TaxID=1448318 RepID=A0A319DXK4_ASPSB|nr:hypothetical protein BO78DRAFT_217018 [Aspergillus sclerotiicarbonarius CBS 121057]